MTHTKKTRVFQVVQNEYALINLTPFGKIAPPTGKKVILIQKVILLHFIIKKNGELFDISHLQFIPSRFLDRQMPIRVAVKRTKKPQEVHCYFSYMRGVSITKTNLRACQWKLPNNSITCAVHYSTMVFMYIYTLQLADSNWTEHYPLQKKKHWYEKPAGRQQIIIRNRSRRIFFFKFYLTLVLQV